jgi:hypothetical protein
MYQTGRCLGVTWFIWNSDGAHPGNEIWPNGALRGLLETAPRYTAPFVPGRGQPPVVDTPTVRFEKVVYFLEEAQRRAEAEGLFAESQYIGEHYTADAIRKRDGMGGQGVVTFDQPEAGTRDLTPASRPSRRRARRTDARREAQIPPPPDRPRRRRKPRP